jgi:hypothetical protein
VQGSQINRGCDAAQFPCGFFNEIKYDSEHIPGAQGRQQELVCYSHKLKSLIMQWKVKVVQESPIHWTWGDPAVGHQTCHQLTAIWHARVAQEELCGCHGVCVPFPPFDILFLDGRPLMQEPIVERHRLLESVVNVIPNLHRAQREMKVIHDEEELSTMMTTHIIREKLEGLVIKEPNSDLRARLSPLAEDQEGLSGGWHHDRFGRPA